MTTADRGDVDRPALIASLLAFRGRDGRRAGVGFLVTDDLAVTCAHVLRPLLHLGPEEDPSAEAGVTVELALPAGGVGRPQPVWATVEHWAPERRGGLGDIAVLRLVSPIPGASPAWLTDNTDGVWGHTARTFGFPAGRPDGVWHTGVLRARQANGWLQFEQTPEAAYEISRGFSGAPVWDEVLAAVIGMVVVADTDRRAAFLIPVGRLAEASPPLRQVVDRHSPFPGLVPFQERDASVFFGRDRESTTIERLVLSNDVVAVFGASGCGKSSVVRAGVVPRLREIGFDVAVVRAGKAAGDLTAALTELSQPGLRGEAHREALRETEAGLAEHGLAAHVIEATGGREKRGVVIVVDQLEELLAEYPGAKEDNPAGVVELIFPETPIPDLHVVTTVRADFIEAIGEHPQLRAALRGETYLLPPMAESQLREVVVQPMRTAPGAGYEDGLDEQILDDIGDSPGALPLLAFTLERLWKRRQGGRLNHSAYRELRGIHGALNEHAERARRLCAEDGLEEAMWRLLLKLIRLPPDGRAPVRHSVVGDELDAVQWRAAGLLSEARIVVVGADRVQPDTVELAHEVLITAWPALRERVERNRDFLSWRDQLRQDQQRWVQANRPDDLLPSDTALEQAVLWQHRHSVELSAADLDYLERGRRRRRGQARRRRLIFLSFSLVVAVASALGALFVNEAQTSRTRAAESASRSLAGASNDLRSADPAVSIMLAIGAYRSAPTDQARDTLLQAHLEFQNVEWLLADARSPSRGLSASRDGRVIVGGTMMGRATIFAREADGRSHQQHLPWERELGYALDHFVTPGGERAGYLSANGTLVWFEVGDPVTGLVGVAHRIPGRHLALRDSYPRRVLAASQDGSRVAAITDGELIIWNLDQDAVEADLGSPKGFGVVTSLWFGPDRDTLLVQHTPPGEATRESASAERLSAVDLATGEVRGVVQNFAQVGVSGDGSTAVICGAGDQFNTVDIATAAIRKVAIDRSCAEFAVDRTGRRVAVGYAGTVDVFDIHDDRTSTRLPRLDANSVTDHPSSYVHRELIEADGELFVLVHAPTGAVLLRQPGAGKELWVGAAVEEAIRADRTGATDVPDQDGLVIDRTGSLLADRVTDGRIDIRDLATLEVIGSVQPEPLPDHASPVDEITLKFLDDRLLLTQSYTVLELWDGRSGSRQARVDLADLGIRHGWGLVDPTPAPMVTAHPEPGHVAVADGGTAIRVVDLLTAREVSGFRIETGDEILVASYHPDGRHATVVRPGGAFWEVWQLDPIRRVLGPMPSPCTRCAEFDLVKIGYPGDGRVLVAGGNAIQVYEPGDSQPVERYSLGQEGYFHGVSADGTTVLYSPVGLSSTIKVIKLDRPQQWHEGLCEVLGWREMTVSEQTMITKDLLTGPVCEPPTSGPRSPPNR
jgi:hypothetical protein